MKKNEIYELKIEDLGNDGEGIGHLAPEGFTVFVPGAVVGDTIRVRLVKVKKSYAYGKIEEVLVASPRRVAPRCALSARCGGCTLMHIDYEEQLAYKKRHVANCLKRIGGIADAEALIEEIHGMEEPFRYRNKMQFPVGLNRDGQVEIGFYAPRSHRIIDLQDCEIAHPINRFLLEELRPWLTKWQQKTGDMVYNEELHKGLVRHILTRVGFSTGELMVCLVINGKDLPSKECEKELIEGMSRAVDRADLSVTLATVSLNVNREKTNRILGDSCKTIFGKDTIEDKIGEVSYHISPLSFYQVNPVQTKVLYDLAVEYAGLSGNEVVWDLYCGIGTISLYLAGKAKEVYGVEIVPQAIEDAKKNAELNGIGNGAFYVGASEDVAPKLLSEHGAPDVIVVDPPRKGCDEKLLETILEAAPKRLVYVSCDPATLARDIKILSEEGYTLVRASVVDQFCHSGHVETVVLMSKVPIV